MKKFTIGFNAQPLNNSEEPAVPAPARTSAAPRKSLVDVYFPDRGRSWTYYNDKFNLHNGDIVYVDGKLEGKQGRVVNVSYSFKIKLSDYKKVIALADTAVAGDFYLAGSHIVTFDRFALPYEKVLTWFKAPPAQEEEYASGNDGESFLLSDLSTMKIKPEIAERGHNYYMENKVEYLSLDGNRGRALVSGTEVYDVEFEYADGEISNIVCSCYCSGACKHEFAAMLQLKETLELINENYASYYGNYFAAIYKGAFLTLAVNNKNTGKLTLE